MTEKQCKEALLRGHGRCLQAVREDPEKFRSVVLWACSHLIAFDPQCEGCKSIFVYELIACYEDPTPFVDVLIQSLRKTRSQGGWKILYFAEVLSYFAADGDASAQQVLWEKYEELYGALLKKKRRPEGIFPEQDDFAMLCQVLGHQKEAMLRIAEDIGRLYRTKEFHDGADFDWLFDSGGKKYRKTLENRAKTSENIAAYLQAGYAEEARWEQMRTQRDPQDRPAGPALSRWLACRADGETVRKYAESYLSATEPESRTTALQAFCRCPFPLDPAPIILDAQSKNAALKSAAWDALERIRHPLVREFALSQLAADMEAALPLLLVNYQPQDAEMLVKLVTSIKVDFACTTNWHGIQMDVLHMEDYGTKAPKVLLRHIYETSYCSCCREFSLYQMGKRRLLTEEFLEECLLDSNSDIRSYARGILNRRSNRRCENGSL